MKVNDFLLRVATQSAVLLSVRLSVRDVEVS